MVAVRIRAEAVLVGHRGAVGHMEAVGHMGAVGRREAAAVQTAVPEEVDRILDTAEGDIGPEEDREAVPQLEDAFLPGSDRTGSRVDLLAAELHPKRRAADNSLGRRVVGPDRRGRKVVAESSLRRITG